MAPAEIARDRPASLTNNHDASSSPRRVRVLSPQLLALWTKYDADGNGTLSRGELAHLLADYAKARALEIEREELPRIQKMMDAEGNNQFVLLLSRARKMAKEAELELFKAQAEGQISAADLQTTFSKLDTDHDVSVCVCEFERATSPMFERLAHY